MKNNHTKYANKLKDIQEALIMIEYDSLLTISISKEMAFHWVPAILLDLDALSHENNMLHAEIIGLSLQNDELLKQNVSLSARLNH